MSEELHRSVGRVEGKLDTVIDMLKRGSDKMDKHDQRITSLERRSWWQSGAAAALGAFLGFGGNKAF